MNFSSTHNLNYKKHIACLFILIFLANLVFAYALLPTKEARAQAAVVTSNPWLQAIQSAWKAIDEVLQKITSAASQTSAGIDMWSQAQTILFQAIRWIIVQLLYKLLAMVSNDIIKWINGGQIAQFVTNWRAYLQNAATNNGLNRFADQYLGRGLMCPSYDAAIAQAFRAPSNFAQEVACPVQNTSDKWANWLRTIQPNGNIYGDYLQTLDRVLTEEQIEKDAALYEALSGGGFLAAKKTDEVMVENLQTGARQHYTGSQADQWLRQPSAGYSTKIMNQRIITPPSILQYETSRTVDSGRELIQQQIAALTPHMALAGINMVPFLSSLFASLIHKMIGNGLSNLTGVGTTPDDTYYYSQLNNAPSLFNPQNWPTSQIAEQTNEMLPRARQLLMHQRLLKENLENELMPQLARQRNILAQMKQLQQNILTTLVEVAKEPLCVLPIWASKQVLNSQIINGQTVETVRVTAIGVGNITFTNTLADTDIGQQSIRTQILEINPEIADPDVYVKEAQQAIADVNAAIPATENYIAAAEEYLEVYKQNATLIGTTVPGQMTTPEAAALQRISEAESKMNTAWNAMIFAAQKVTGTSSTDLNSLILDTQNTTLRVVERAANLKSELDNPESSIYQQLAGLQRKGQEAQNAIQTCRQYLLDLQEQQQQQQQPTNPFKF